MIRENLPPADAVINIIPLAPCQQNQRKPFSLCPHTWSANLSLTIKLLQQYLRGH